MVGLNRSEKRNKWEKKRGDEGGVFVAGRLLTAPSYGAILSGEGLNAPREKDLLSSGRRKLDYLSGYKDDQTAYITKYALAVGWLKVRKFS